ncbi:hypothetical protein GCM10022270_23350 [Terriglobus aquaticus]
MVRVGALKEGFQALGNLVGREDAVAVAIERHEALLEIGVGGTIGLLGQVFVLGELAVVVAVERKEALRSFLDLVGRELAVVVQVERFQNETARRCLRAGLGLERNGDEGERERGRKTNHRGKWS